MRTTMILVILVIMVEGDIDPDATHYDYQQGIGKIIENYHYINFHINISSLRGTYNKILNEYTLLSLKEEFRNSSLLEQAKLLCNEIFQDLQEIAPFGKRSKRGLINGLGKVIKFVFGNPDADDLERINDCLTAMQQQQYDDILVLNKSISVMNEISRAINNNTEVVNKNLRDLLEILGGQNTRLNLFETLVTLIVQEQHFLNFLGKIKRSFVFTEEMFSLEILTREQIVNIKNHLSELYAQKELIMHYQNLLDFRFVQGSIVIVHDSIIYTLKIPILNPIEFSLFQRLAVINKNNQTEIVTTPWKLNGLLLELFSNKCQLMYQNNYLCNQLTLEKRKSIIISIDVSLVLAYPLTSNLTLVSSNYLVTITDGKDVTMFQGTKFVNGNKILIQGHDITKNLGEYRLLEIQPIIIENHQRSFEPLKTVVLPMMETIVSKQIGIGFHMSIISIVVVVLFLLIGVVYWLYKRLNQKAPSGQVTKDEGVFQLGRGGVI